MSILPDHLPLDTSNTIVPTVNIATGTINDELLKSMGINLPSYGDAAQAGKPADTPAISVPPGYKVVKNADGSLSVVPE